MQDPYSGTWHMAGVLICVYIYTHTWKKDPFFSGETAPGIFQIWVLVMTSVNPRNHDRILVRPNWQKFGLVWLLSRFLTFLWESDSDDLLLANRMRYLLHVRNNFRRQPEGIDTVSTFRRWKITARCHVGICCWEAMKIFSNHTEFHPFTTSRWWQLKNFSFAPLLGEMIQFDKYFSIGLTPPTSFYLAGFSLDLKNSGLKSLKVSDPVFIPWRLNTMSIATTMSKLCHVGRAGCCSFGCSEWAHLVLPGLPRGSDFWSKDLII